MLKTYLLLLTALQLTGCASLLDGNNQAIQVSTFCGQRAIPASCVAFNSKGSWAFNTPQEVVVSKDHFYLTITCQSPFFDPNTVNVPPSLNPTITGNVLVGGLVGAGVDVVTGSGLGYSRVVNISYPSCL